MVLPSIELIWMRLSSLGGGAFAGCRCCPSHAGAGLDYGRTHPHRGSAIVRYGPPDFARLVHRYNDLGLAGLSDRVAPGPKPRLLPEQEAEVAQLVREGPTFAEHGVVRWRRIDLSRVIERRFGVHLAERSVGTLLHRLGFRRLSARHAIQVTTRRPRRRTKKLRRPCRRCDPRTRSRQTDRALVARRSAYRPARYADTSMGEARQPTICTARLPL